MVGSRAVFVCHENGEEYSPGIYIHWGGGEVLDLLRRAAPHMNMYDASEAAARLARYGRASVSLSWHLASPHQANQEPIAPRVGRNRFTWPSSIAQPVR